MSDALPPPYPPSSDILHTESDVEQKLVFQLLTHPFPHGLGIPAECIFTKPDIRRFEIGKGNSAKIYYPDYVATFFGMPILIVEAKAPNVIDLTEAIREARLYALELNSRYKENVNPCRFCVVSNGLITELRHWDSDELLAKFSLAEVSVISPAFAQFAEKISGTVLKAEAAKMHRQLSPKRFERPVNLVGGVTIRNEAIEFNQFGRILNSQFQNFFNPNTWEDRKRIVRDAYVPSRRKDRYVDEIDHVIKAAAPAKIKEAQLIDDSSKPVEIASKLANPNELRNKIILLIGSVGSGKSTFVDYLQEVALSPEIRNSLAWVRIDLNDAPVSASEIYGWCRENLILGIKSTSTDLDLVSLDGLRKLYKSEVHSFETGEGSLFTKDSEEHRKRLADLLSNLKKDQSATLKALERYLCTGRGRLLVVGLDNCDKRNRDEQLLMFQVAKWIQQEVRCLVILPLRQETFENHRHEPPLDTALKDLIYRIQPPPFQEVLSQRLKLILADLKNTGTKTLRYQMNSATVEITFEKLERFFHLMMGSLFAHKKYGRNIIIGIAGWDIRKAFEIFLEFCRSGYISESDIFGAQATGDHHFLSQSIIARVLLRTNRRYYDGDQSYIKNLFQCDPSSQNPDPFLRYRILSWLRNKSKDAGPNGMRGFHRFGDLIKSLTAHGADEVTTRMETLYLIKARCILTEHLKIDTLDDGDLIGITPAGHVHLDLSRHDLYYLAACAEDCWLADKNLAENIRRRITLAPLKRALSWGVVLDTAEDLANYLDTYRSTSPSSEAHFLANDDRSSFDINFVPIKAAIKTAKEHYFTR